MIIAVKPEQAWHNKIEELKAKEQEKGDLGESDRNELKVPDSFAISGTDP